MPLEEREIDEYKKERRIWLLISVISGIVFVGLMTATIYYIRFRYGFFVVTLAFIVMFMSFLMYAFTQYISTKEILSILARKISGNDD